MTSPNMLRYDPTQTTTLRRKFAEDLRGRFAALNTEIVKLLVEENALGLGQETDEAGFVIVVNSRWSFLPAGAKLVQFSNWLKTQIDEKIFGKTIDGYVEMAYDKGGAKAAAAVAAQNLAAGTEPGTVLSVLRPKLALEKLAIVKIQTMNALKGLGEAVAARASDIMASGLVQGLSPREMARNITKAVSSIGKVRATTIARTETIRAHAEGALDVMEAMGVTDIGVEVEWSTTGDKKVCPKCASLQGVIIPIKHAHGMFPRHPNCRCSPIPAFEAVNKQKLKDAIASSLAAGKAKKGKGGKGAGQVSVEKSGWPGPAVQSFLSGVK